jgi:hypothetical protein
MALSKLHFFDTQRHKHFIGSRGSLQIFRETKKLSATRSDIPRIRHHANRKILLVGENENCSVAQGGILKNGVEFVASFIEPSSIAAIHNENERTGSGDVELPQRAKSHLSTNILSNAQSQ